MAEREWVDQKQLEKLNAKVKKRGYLDREELLNFVRLIGTSDSAIVKEETEKWLNHLHESPDYENVRFPEGDISAVLGDLEAYGIIADSTILSLRDNSTRSLS